MLRAILSMGLAVSTMMAGASPPIPSEDRAVINLCKYISIDTSNPPGNEKAGAEFLAGILRAQAVPATIYDVAPGRAIVYAKLAGSGKKRPVILLNHIDVVPARAEDWEHPPFKGQVINGEICGRGALDMKSMGIAELQALLNIKESGVQHDRDIIFLGTPDEEVGGAAGAGWICKNHPELVKDAEFLINEGGYIDAAADGQLRAWMVDVAEKSPLWLKISTTGDAGHGSMPMGDAAPNRLVRALTKIVNSPPAPEVLPAVKTFFETLADSEQEPMKSYYKNIVESVKNPPAYEMLLKNRLHSSMLRNTVSLTVLKAGYKTNVIPAEASAELDCRLLPGTDQQRFIKQVEDTIGDSSVNVSVLEWQPIMASPVETELFKAIADVARAPGPYCGPVVPAVVPWATDSHFFRKFGTIAYGIAPFKVDPQHLATMHGKNERLPEKTFKDGLTLLTDIIQQISK